MKSNNSEQVLPFVTYHSIDAQVQAVLEALQKNKKRLATDLSIIASALSPSIPECHALCAEMLSQAKEPLLALKTWDNALQRSPWQTGWFIKALSFAWSISEDSCFAKEAAHYAASWIALLRRIFIAAPPPELLEELETRNLIKTGTGCAGVHLGKLMGWMWIPTGEALTIGISDGNLDTSSLTVQRIVYKNRDLVIFSFPLPYVDTLFFITITAASHVNEKITISCDSTAYLQKLKKIPDNTLRSPVLIIIPVYDDKAATLSCLGSVFASKKFSKTLFDILVLWDQGPDKTLYDDLKRLAVKKQITLVSTPKNLGFLSCINYGLRYRSPRQDVILLNSDTLVCDNWVDRLKSAASLPKTATVTPLGSEAELVSFPSFTNRAHIHTLRATRRIDDACRKAALQKRAALTIPVGVGFCMYITHAALTELKGLDGYTLFSGYGEEVDFCLRARKKGFHNLAAYNVFVAHLGGRSFGPSKKALAAQNNKALFIRYPDYKNEYDNFLANDPLWPYKKNIAEKLYRPLKGALHIYSRTDANLPKRLLCCAQHIRDGKDWASLLVQPSGHEIAVTLQVVQEFPLPDQSYTLPSEYTKLQASLDILSPDNLEVHHSGRIVQSVADMLPYPQQNKHQEYAHYFDTETLNHIDSCEPLLMTTPRTLNAWLYIQHIARLYPQRTFWVLDLNIAIQNAPHPANIRSLSKIDEPRALGVRSLFILPDSLEIQDAWKKWAIERSLNTLFSCI